MSDGTIVLVVYVVWVLLVGGIIKRASDVEFHDDSLLVFALVWPGILVLAISYYGYKLAERVK